MSEILLEAIAEKLNIQDKTLIEIKNSISQYPGKEKPDTEIALNSLAEEIKELRTLSTVIKEDLHSLLQKHRGYNNLMRFPPTQNIKHHHYLNAGILISCTLALILSLTATFAYNKSLQLKSYETVNLKYRYLKLQHNIPLWDAIHQADSLFNRDEAQFKRNILNIEGENIRQAKLYQQIKEKDKEIENLKSKLTRIK